MDHKDKIVALSIRTAPSLRWPALVLAAAALGACATAPKAPPPPPPAPVAAAPVAHDHAADFRTAYDHYTQGQQAAAVEIFDRIVADSGADAGARRAAHLGKALVYLSADKQLHNAKNARAEVTAANELASAGDGPMAALDGYLTSAIEAVLAADANVTDLNAKLAKANKDKAALESERTALLAEQEKLKAALDKLKKVTLEK